MTQIWIEAGVQLAGAIVIALIGACGTVLTAVLAKKQSLASVNAAQQEALAMARLTAEELQQTVAEGLKKASGDGKLTQQEIQGLKTQLVTMTVQKLSQPTIELLKAAAVDVSALIVGAAESWLDSRKQR